VHEESNRITTTSNHKTELVKFEYPVIDHIYNDPITIYMEELLFSEYPLIPKVSGIVHSPRTFCCKDQDGKKFMMPIQVLFLILIVNIERVESLEQLLDWMH
jgi:hypothetical protein